MISTTFSDYIKKRTQQVHSKAVLLLSPCWEELPSQVKCAYKSIGAALFAFHKAALDGIKDKAAAVLLDITAFEAYGLSGMVCLKSTIDYAKELGLIVLADTSKNGALCNIRTAAKAWIAPVDASLPEDSPLREGGFDCDALSFTVPLEEDAVRAIATEAERYGAGILLSQDGKQAARAIDAAKAIGKETCGLLLRGECKAILGALPQESSFISLACPTGFQDVQELKAVSSQCTLIAAPREVKTPQAFLKFTEII